MELLKCCDQCGASAFVQINQQKLPTRNAKGDAVEVELIDVMCKSCGLIFRNPQPTEKEFAEYYEQRAAGTDSLPAFILTSEHRADESNVSPALKRNQFEYFTRHLGSKRGRILEVGCFEGLLLSLFKKDGWQTFGVEPGVKSARIARERHGIEVKNEFLRPGLWSEPFDAIMMVHVLEHVRSPLETLKILRGMMREDGRLFIEVPNILTFPENNLSSFFNYEHLYYFSPRTLASMLGVAGFEVVEISGDFGAPIIRAIARPGSPKSIGSAFDEFSTVRAKIERQDKLIADLKTKVAGIIARAGEKRVVIYGAGVHTELLFRLSHIEKMNIVGIVDIEKRGTLFGHQIRPVSDIPALNPGIVIISSYAYQEEIYKNLRQYEPKVEIVKLYDYVFELENMKA